MKRRMTPIVAVIGIAWATACSPVDNLTQITVALSAETQIPSELDGFTVRVFATRTSELRFSHDYYPTSGAEFPTTLAIIPSDESSLSSPVRIEVEGQKAGVVFLQRQSVISFIKDRNTLLTMPLRMACFNFGDCGVNGTCAGGRCVSAVTDASKLGSFEPSYVYGEAGTCFDEQACLSGDAEDEVAIANDCTFAIPSGAPSGTGNVSIRWAAASARVLGLEADDGVEGWTRLSSSEGQLSPGVCDAKHQRKATSGALLVADVAEAVYFSRTCRSKTAREPFCISRATGQAGIGASTPLGTTSPPGAAQSDGG